VLSKFTRRVADKAAVDTHLHALRHFSATQAIAAGFDAVTVGTVYVPPSTSSRAAGKVTLGGLGLFAKQRTVEGYENGTVRYTCPDPGCHKSYVVDALDVANLAIEAAGQHLRGFRLPSSRRG
jgi:hypothetical protein